MLPSFFFWVSAFSSTAYAGAPRSCRKSLLYFTWSSLDSPQSVSDIFKIKYTIMLALIML